MAVFVASFTAAGVPLVAPATAPTVRVRRTDTGALVVTDAAMTELGDGSFQYVFATDPSLAYSIRADGDPLGAGQLDLEERYQFGSIDGLTAQAEILTAYDNGVDVSIHFDSSASNTGTVLGVDGTVNNPVSTEAAMLSLASQLNINSYAIRGLLTLTQGYAGARLYSAQGDSAVTLLNLNGQDLAGASVQDLAVFGVQADTVCAYVRCNFFAATISGNLRDCGIQNPAFTPGSALIMQDCRALLPAGGAPVEMDLSGLTGNANLRTFAGDLLFKNFTNAGGRVEVCMLGGQVDIDASCTAGTIQVEGNAIVVDNSAGTTVDTTRVLRPDYLVPPADVINDVLARVLSDADYAVSGSVGQALATLIGDLQVDIAGQQWVLRDGAGVTVQTWPLSTDGGEPITTQSGVQTRRGKGAL